MRRVKVGIPFYTPRGPTVACCGFQVRLAISKPVVRSVCILRTGLLFGSGLPGHGSLEV